MTKEQQIVFYKEAQRAGLEEFLKIAEEGSKIWYPHVKYTAMIRPEMAVFSAMPFTSLEKSMVDKLRLFNDRWIELCFEWEWVHHDFLDLNADIYKAACKVMWGVNAMQPKYCPCFDIADLNAVAHALKDIKENGDWDGTVTYSNWSKLNIFASSIIKKVRKEAIKKKNKEAAEVKATTTTIADQAVVKTEQKDNSAEVRKEIENVKERIAEANKLIEECNRLTLEEKNLAESAEYCKNVNASKNSFLGNDYMNAVINAIKAIKIACDHCNDESKVQIVTFMDKLLGTRKADNDQPSVEEIKNINTDETSVELRYDEDNSSYYIRFTKGTSDEIKEAGFFGCSFLTSNSNKSLYLKLSEKGSHGYIKTIDAAKLRFNSKSSIGMIRTYFGIRSISAILPMVPVRFDGEYILFKLEKPRQ